MASKLFSGMFGKPKDESQEAKPMATSDANVSADNAGQHANNGPKALSMHDLEAMIGLLDKRIKALEAEVQLLKRGSATPQPTTEAGLITASMSQPGATHEPKPARNTQTTLYMAAPNPDGTFTDFSEHEQIGKSIYRLKTDGANNGTFAVLDTADATATAAISISQFIKPACKIVGNTAVTPSRIVTEQEGLATFDGEAWTTIKKAVVRMEK